MQQSRQDWNSLQCVSELSDTYQSWTNVSTNHFPFPPCETGEKSHCCADSMFSFASILSQGFWTYLNKTSSNSAALFTNSGRKKEKFNSPQRSGTLFFSFFIYYLRHGRNKTQRESDGAKLSATYTWPCFLNYLPSAAPLKKAESVLYVPTHNSYKAILQVWFSQLFFKALVVCPLISPLVSVCLSTYKKYNLTCNDFVRWTNAIFSKAKFVDKGWILLIWNVVCHKYASAVNSKCVLCSGLLQPCVICANFCSLCWFAPNIRCTSDT